MKSIRKHHVLVLAALVSTTGFAHDARHFGRWSDPQPVAAINTAAAEGCPIESHNGRSLYFASNRAAPGAVGKLDIYRASRSRRHPGWGEAENLGAPVNSPEFDYCPTPLVGGWLMFVSSQPTDDDCYPGDAPPPPPPGGPSAGDIYLAHEGRHGWWGPFNLGCNKDGPNTAGAEFSPSLVLTAEGLFLYFSSNGYADSQGQDIYVSRLRRDGSFSPGERVLELSTAADDRMPNVRQDGLEIVFSSNRAGTDPFDQDIYVATRPDTASPWSPPQRIRNPQINTSGSETRASLSSDGRRLYFGRKRDASDPGDVYVSTRIQRYKR